MASVNFPAALGGDGQTYSSAGESPRDMQHDGHRQWFMPLCGNIVGIGQFLVGQVAAAVQTLNEKLAAANTTANNVAASAAAAASSAASASVSANAAQQAAATAPAVLLRNVVAGMGCLPGWSYARSGGSTAQPAQITLARDNERVREDLTWSNSRLVKVVYRYSTNSGGSWVPLGDEAGRYVLTVNYDANGYVLTTSWGNAE